MDASEVGVGEILSQRHGNCGGWARFAGRKQGNPLEPLGDWFRLSEQVWNAAHIEKAILYFIRPSATRRIRQTVTAIEYRSPDVKATLPGS